MSIASAMEETERVHVRLVRHDVRLADGATVGVAVAGWGVPLVVVHGFTAEAFLYAQTLGRLVSMGFKVIAVDVAGHGGSSDIPLHRAAMHRYVDRVAEALDALGIGACIAAGHSMGGRIALELAARRPDQVKGIVLIDAIVGESWDRRIKFMRVCPAAAAVELGVLAVDVISTGVVFDRPRQVMHLSRGFVRTYGRHLTRPWRLLSPALAIATAPPSAPLIERVRSGGTHVAVLHGDRDFGVPLTAARQAAKGSNGDLVVVRGGTHVWLLKDPDTLPNIVDHLLDAELGDAYDEVVLAAGLDPATATVDDIEKGCYEAASAIAVFTSRVEWKRSERRRRPGRYRWHASPAVS